MPLLIEVMNLVMELNLQTQDLNGKVMENRGVPREIGSETMEKTLKKSCIPTWVTNLQLGPIGIMKARHFLNLVFSLR